VEKQRELNPQLFGTAPLATAPVQPRAMPAASMPPYAPNELKNMESQIAGLGRGLAQMEKRTGTIAAKMEELARGVHSRLERFAQTIQRLEETQKHVASENSTKMANIVSKVNERKVNDSKIEEMIERHNAIVRGFEARLLSLQRLVNEQEMALHGARATLEEVRRK
jgi:septal ring factor EnvC (AmiA/AmiB activator)